MQIIQANIHESHIICIYQLQTNEINLANTNGHVKQKL